jgi:hypothetical protein
LCAEHRDFAHYWHAAEPSIGVAPVQVPIEVLFA